MSRLPSTSSNCVVHPATQHMMSLAGVGMRHGGHHPVELLGHVDTDRQRVHCAPSTRTEVRLPPAVLALHSDGSHSLISGPEGAAGRAAKRSEPSTDSQHESHTRPARTWLR